MRYLKMSIFSFFLIIAFLPSISQARDENNGKWVEVLTTNGCITRSFAPTEKEIKNYSNVKREWTGGQCQPGMPINGTGILTTYFGSFVVTINGNFVEGVLDGPFTQANGDLTPFSSVANRGCRTNQPTCVPFNQNDPIATRFESSKTSTNNSAGTNASTKTTNDLINSSTQNGSNKSCRDAKRDINNRYPEILSIPGNREMLSAYESGPCANESDKEMYIANSKRLLAASGVSISSGTSLPNRGNNDSTSSNGCRQKIISIQSKGDVDMKAAAGDAIRQAKAMYNASAGQEALFSGECASDPQASSYVSSARSAMRDWGSKCQQFGGDASCGGSSVAIAAAAKATAAKAMVAQTAASQTVSQQPNAVPLYRDPPVQNNASGGYVIRSDNRDPGFAIPPGERERLAKEGAEAATRKETAYREFVEARNIDNAKRKKEDEDKCISLYTSRFAPKSVTSERS